MTDSVTETRCPACQTVFAVEAEDLARAGGRVRCGDCLHVFDARAHAIEGAADSPEGEDSHATGTRDDASGGAAAPGNLRDKTEGGVSGVGGDHAEDIDDTPFTATNWFIVDEAGELAPMDGATNDAAARDDEDVLSFRLDDVTPEDRPPEIEDSGAFRFGDDTPPDTLRAELAALVGDDVEDSDDDGRGKAESPTPDVGVAGASQAPAAAADDAGPAAARPTGIDDREIAPPEREAEPAASAPQTDTDTQDDDWDELLGELDEEFDARLDALQTDAEAEPAPEPEPGDPADVEPEPASEPASEPAPEPETEIGSVGETTASGREPTREDANPPQIDEAPAAAREADAAPLDFELVETDEAGRETSLDLDLTRATGKTATPDFRLLDDEMPAADIAPVDIELGGADEPESAALDLELEEAATEAAVDDTPSAREADGGDAEPPETPASDVDEFNATALDDMMDALQLLEEGAEEDEAAVEVAADDDTRQDPGADAAPATGDAGPDDDASAEGEAPAPEPDEPEPAETPAMDTDDRKRGVGEDTINAMAEGERGEVIVLGGEDEPEAGAAVAAHTDARDDHDTTFAESMIISPDLAPGPRRTGLWLTLSVLAALGLVVQAVHGSRGKLATMPFWQDVLPTVYDTIGMPLAPEWDIRRWCVETSGALASEAGLDIEAIFSNRADTALPPPELKVRIVDAYSNTLAATLLSPADYLAASTAATRVAPGARITALARLDYNEPRLDGYEVSLCYRNADGTLRCGTGCNDGD